jgi:hypothetical protein
MLLISGFFIFRLWVRYRDRDRPRFAANAPSSEPPAYLVDIIRSLLESHESDRHTINEVLKGLHDRAEAQREREHKPDLSASAQEFQKDDNARRELAELKKDLLTCSICREMFLNPVSVITDQTIDNQGCLHNFCGMNVVDILVLI